MNKLYEEIVFHNNESPDLNEENLNAMSKALNDIDDRVIDGYAAALLVKEYVGTVTEAAESAAESATNAAQSVTDAAEQATLAEGYAEEAAKGSGGNALAYADNVLQLKRDDTVLSEVEIHSSVEVEVATTEKAGIVKPDGTTITVDTDGTIHSAGSVPDDIVTYDNESVPTSAIPRDADSLGGYDASEYLRNTRIKRTYTPTLASNTGVKPYSYFASISIADEINNGYYPIVIGSSNIQCMCVFDQTKQRIGISSAYSDNPTIEVIFEKIDIKED